MASVAVNAATLAAAAQPRARVIGFRMQLTPSVRTTSSVGVSSSLRRTASHEGVLTPTLAGAACRAGRALDCIRYGGRAGADWRPARSGDEWLNPRGPPGVSFPAVPISQAAAHQAGVIPTSA